MPDHILRNFANLFYALTLSDYRIDLPENSSKSIKETTFFLLFRSSDTAKNLCSLIVRQKDKIARLPLKCADKNQEGGRKSHQQC